MKIAFLSFYSGHIYRGVETYVDELARRLAKNHQVTVYQAGPALPDRPYHTRVFPVSFPVVWPADSLPTTHILKRLFLHYYKRQEFLFFLKAFSHLHRSSPDYIIPLNSGWVVPLLRLYTWLTRKKLLLVGQSGPGWDDRFNLFCHPDVFVCLTNVQKAWAKKATLWKNQSFAVIGNGVDMEKFTPHGPKAELPLKKPLVLIAAATVKSKRVAAAIKAVAKTSMSLLVLGKGPLDQKCDALGKKLLGSKRYLRATVTHDYMPRYYRSADVFTLCSDSSEAFGIVYLEALAAGIPCVATDDPSRREILGDVGLYVRNPANSKAYAAKLKLALSSCSSDQLVSRAAAFSWDSIAARYQQLFTGND